MLNVLIGDDLVYLLHHLEIMLKDLGHNVAGKCTTATDVVRLYRQLQPDLTIMDIRGMDSYYDEEDRDIDTFEAMELIRKFDPKARIIIITATPDEKYVKSAIKQEANGILVKGFSKEKLQETINKIMSGKI
jgi:two-component system chemotaxis response regulator CheY